MHEAHAQHRAGPGQPRVRERRAVVGVEHDGHAAAHDRPAQQLLAGPGVLVGEEPAVDDQAGVVVDDQEQPGPHRPVDAGPGHPRADEHVGDPPVVGRARPRSGRTPSARPRAPRGAARPGAAGPAPCAPRPGSRGGDTGSRRSARPSGRAAPSAARPPRRTAPGGPAPRPCRPGPRASARRARRPARPAPTGRSFPASSGARCRRGASGPASAIARTTAPRSAGVRRGLVASAITAEAVQRDRLLLVVVHVISSVLRPVAHGTGGMKRRLPTIR